MALQKPGLSNKEELVSGWLKRFLTIGLCCFCMTGECLTAESDEIVLYSNEFSLPGLKMSVADRTIDVVSKAVAPRKLVIKTVSLPELEGAILQRKADIAIVGSAIYWRNIQNGMRDIATLVTPLQPDPDHAVGALIVTLKDRSDIQNIQDLKGKRLGVNLPNGFQCYLTLLKDLADQGYDHKHFFSNVTAYGLLPQRRLDALKRGEVDAVTLNACYAERMRKQGIDVLDGLKPVGVRDQSEVRCMTSTSLYPNWSFLISPNLDTQTIVKIASALHRMSPGEDGQYWSIASSFTAADELYRTLKMGPYAYLDDWTLERIWSEYKSALLFCALLLFFGIWHSLRTQQLVNVRTQQLNESFAVQQRLQAQAKEAADKYTAIKHAFSVSQLSSLVAHELSQPLASVLLYAQGLKVMTQDAGPDRWDQAKLKEGIDKIIARTSRAQEIVKTVRAYAKADDIDFLSIDLCKLLRHVVKQVSISHQIKRTRFCLQLPDDAVTVSGSPLELELAFANLIQNSLEAVAKQPEPMVSIRLDRIDDTRCLIVFSDSGPAVSDEVIDRIKEPVKSLKPGGLGLGLSIVHAIVEKHMGRLTFDKTPQGGVRVTIILPTEEKQD